MGILNSSEEIVRSVIRIFLLTLIILLSGFISTAQADELSDLIRTRRYINQWTSVKPFQIQSQDITNQYWIEIPGFSSVMIKCDEDIITLERVYYTGTEDESSLAYVKLPIPPKNGDQTILAPIPGRYITYRITTLSDQPVRFFYSERFHVGVYWSKLRSYIAHNGAKAIKQIRDIYTEESNHLVPWFRQWWDMLEHMPEDSRSEDSPRSIIDDSIKAKYLELLCVIGKLIDHENTFESQLNLIGNQLIIAGQNGKILDSPQILEIYGPGMIELDLRRLWSTKPQDPVRPVEIFFTIDQQSQRSAMRDFRPDLTPEIRIEKKIQSTTENFPIYSFKEQFHIFIPPGYHQLQIKTEHQIWGNAQLVALRSMNQTQHNDHFNSIHMDWIGEFLLPMEIDPSEQRINFQQLEQMRMDFPNDPTLEQLYSSLRNTVQWDHISIPGRWMDYIDHPNPISEFRLAEMTYNAAGNQYYTIETSRNYMVTATDLPPLAFAPIQIIAPHESFNSSVEYFVDGKRRIIPSLQNPNFQEKNFTVFLQSGQHNVRFEFDGSAMYTAYPLESAQVVVGYQRTYYPLTDRNEAVSLILPKSTKQLRVLCRTSDNYEPVGLNYCLDMNEPVDVWCEVNHSERKGYSAFTIDVPSGSREIRFWKLHSIDTVLINVSARTFQRNRKSPEFKVDNIVKSTTSDGRYPDVRPEIGMMVIDLIHRENRDLKFEHPNLDHLCRYLQSSDLESSINEIINTAELLSKDECILLEATVWLKHGYPYFAWQLLEPIFSSQVEYPEWLLIAVMEIGLKRHDIVLTSIAASKLLKIHPDNEAARLAIALCHNHVGDSETAVDVLQGIPGEYCFHGESIRVNDVLESVKINSESWQQFETSNPNFKHCPENRITGQFKRLQWIDNLKHMHQADETSTITWNNEKYYMTTDDNMQIKITGPSMVEFNFRPIYSNDEQNDTIRCPETCIQISSGTRNIHLPLTGSGLERSSIFVNELPSDMYLGQRHVLIWPLWAGEKSISLRCHTGRFLVDVNIQTPGLMDLATQLNVENLKAKWRSVESELVDDCKVNAAEMLRLHSAVEIFRAENVNFQPIRSLGKWFNDFVEWRSIRGQSERLTPTWLSVRESNQQINNVAHQPLILSLGVNDSQAIFDLQNSLITHMKLSLLNPVSDEHIYVQMGDDIVGILNTSQPEISIASEGEKLCKVLYAKDSKSDIRIRVEGFDSLDNPVKVTPVNRKRFISVKANHIAEYNVRGPTIVRLEIRRLITQANTTNSLAWIEINTEMDPLKRIDLPVIPSSNDPDVLYAKVSLPIVEVIPLMDNKNYRIRVLTDDRCGREWLTRMYGLTTSIKMIDDGAKKIGIPLEKRTEIEDEKLQIGRWEDINNSRVNSAFSVIEHDQCYTDNGTWSIGLEYENREDEDVVDEEWSSEDSDGIETHVGYSRPFKDRQIFFKNVFGGIFPEDEPDDPVLYENLILKGCLPIDFRFSSRFSIHTQSIQSSQEYTTRFRFDIRRTIHLFSWLSLTPAIGYFYTNQSLTESEVYQLDNQPEPSLYTNFSHRHDNGLMFKSDIRLYLTENWFIFTRFRTISEGEGDSDFMGPWWLIAGSKAIFGPMRMSIDFTERDSFGNSLEPNRSRFKANFKYYKRWNSKIALEFDFTDRYTFDTEENKIETGVSIFIHSGRLFRDFDPNEIDFLHQVESAIMGDW